MCMYLKLRYGNEIVLVLCIQFDILFSDDNYCNVKFLFSKQFFILGDEIILYEEFDSNKLRIYKR